MKRLIKPLLILAVFQIGMTVLLRILKGRFLSQEISEGEINAVGVRGGAQEKVTSTNFRGGYLRAVMGGVELDLTEATVEEPPATLVTTIVMGGVEIKVPESWKVRNDIQVMLGGVHQHVSQEPNEGENPDLVLIGKIIMGGVSINHSKKEEVAVSSSEGEDRLG